MSDQRRSLARSILHAAGWSIVASAAGHSALLLGADLVVLVPTFRLLSAAELASLLLPHAFLCVITVTALLLYAKRGGHVAWRLGALVAAIAAVASAARLDGRTASALLLPGAAAAAGLLASLVDRRRMRVIAPAVMATMLVWLITRPSIRRTNRFSLLSYRPNSTETVDYSGNTRKDDYPVCTFRYNSLGYRDEEPQLSSNRALVLVVGDSFVWGDGIVRNDETLSAQLRRRLEEAAPGRYAVTSAAFPGLGMYGYRRIIESLVPELHPAIIVVGYLGVADLDVLDPQLLLDVLPEGSVLSLIVSHLGTLQALHQGSRQLGSSGYRIPDRLPPHLAGFFDVLENFCRDEARRAILIDYFPHDRPLGAASRIEVFGLPPALRFEGRSSALWYAKDCHPRAPLNETIGQLVAQVIAGGKRIAPPEPDASGESASSASTGDNGGHAIPPGQEDLVGRLLGAGAAPIGGCELASANIRPASIEARYRCPGSADSTLVLRHVSQGASSGQARTEKFSVAPGGPDTPRALLDAVVARIGQAEDAFLWIDVQPKPSAKPPADGLRLRLFLLLAVVASGAALVGLRWRSGADPPSSPTKKA